MDCIIVGSSSVRVLCAAMACLSRVGKDLYIEFDPLEGLKLSTWNDAKSVFSEFHLEPAFFHQCRSTTTSYGTRDNHAFEDERQQRPHLSTSTSTSSSSRKRTRNNPERQRHGRASPTSHTRDCDDDQEYDYEEGDDDNEQQDVFTCRIPFRALVAVIRPRKNVSSLRLRQEIDSSHVYLSFEFNLMDHDQEDEKTTGIFEGHMSNGMTISSDSYHDYYLRVIHRVGVVDDVNTMAAVVSLQDPPCSELTVSPKVLSRMLDPLKHTFQVAFVINNVQRTISATSYHHHHQSLSHHTDTSNNNNNGNAVLEASTAKLIKTETSIGCDELDEYDFCNDRISHDDDGRDMDLPPNVNEQVTLIYSIKEAKAMFTFCSLVSSNNFNDNLIMEDLKVHMSFHWGGRPVVMETSSKNFSARLVLATARFSSS